MHTQPIFGVLQFQFDMNGVDDCSIPLPVSCFLFFSCSGALMSTVYEEKQDKDGFLYVTYSGENTFGDQILPYIASVDYIRF